MMKEKCPNIIESKKFLTSHERPIYSNDYQLASDSLKKSPRLAIVIQGGILKDNDFTLETIKMYAKTFQNTKIILSTWDDEDSKYLQKFEDLEITVVLSKKPDYFGIGNINLQIESSKNGLKKAKEMGFEYAIKTRTDQRIYAPNVKEFLFNIIEAFPLAQNIKIQKSRLVALSLNTFKYRLYGVSDMFLFGDIDDMLLYWDVDYDGRLFEEIDEQSRKNIKEYCLCRLAEVYFSTEFLKKIGREIDFTLKDSWTVYANHFCVIDKESLDLYWPKYNNLEYRWLKYEPSMFEELTFREWFNLYTGLDNKQDCDDEILNREYCNVCPSKIDFKYFVKYPRKAFKKLFSKN